MSPLSRAMARKQNLLVAALICSAPATSIAHPVTYRVTGTAHKGELSDNLYGSASDPVGFEVTFTAEIEQARVVPPRTKVRLPNTPEARFPETGYLLPSTAVSSFSFSLASGAATFSQSNIVADPDTGGVIFLTGSLARPSSIHMILANARSGFLQIGVPDCSRTCRLQGGVVLDSAGPFGTLEINQITPTPSN